MKIIPLFLIILLLFSTLPLYATEEAIQLTGDVQMRLGDAFMEEGEYYRAVTEYKKYLILFPEGRQADTALFKAATASYLGSEYDTAVDTFATVRSRFPKSRHAAESAYQEAICHLRMSRFDRAAAAFEAAAAYPADDRFAPKARLARALVQFDKENIPESRKDLTRFLNDFPADPRKEKVREALTLLPQTDELPHKSPVVAGILSALLPGSGHIYAGHYGDGVTALLLNGLFIAGTVVAVQQENYAVAGVAGVIGLPFYAGNIYGAANAASKWNLGVRKGISEKLAVTLDIRF